MKLLTAILFLAPFASAQFYVKDQQYRFPADDARCRVNKFCDFEEHKSGDNHDFSINFVEVKGNGSYFDPNQLERARVQIEKARYDGKQTPLVFVYIHGWHNNADELENPANRVCPDLKGDVAKFRDCGLAELAKTYPTVKGAPPAVVGIYLAWQGMDFTPASLIAYVIPSYPLRRAAATHVGMTGMCEAFGKILETVHEHREQYVVVAMGHSFGARVLENADEAVDPARQCGAMKRFKENAKQGSTETRPPADLIFYVNAATSNTNTRRTIKDWNEICKKTPDNPVCDRDPFYLAVSSRTDFATGLIQPIANLAFLWFPTSLKPLRFEVVPFSAANSFWMHTHHDPDNLRTAPCPAPQTSSICFLVPISTHGPNTYADTYTVESRSKARKRFWILNTGRRFIRNHGDVWNPKIFALVQAVMLANAKYREGIEGNTK